MQKQKKRAPEMLRGAARVDDSTNEGRVLSPSARNARPRNGNASIQTHSLGYEVIDIVIVRVHRHTNGAQIRSCRDRSDPAFINLARSEIEEYDVLLWGHHFGDVHLHQQTGDGLPVLMDDCMRNMVNI